jgi:hypothetical protein
VAKQVNSRFDGDLEEAFDAYVDIRGVTPARALRELVALAIRRTELGQSYSQVKSAAWYLNSLVPVPDALELEGEDPMG